MATTGTHYWVISDEDFIEALRRAHEGESPVALYAEFYLDSDHEAVD